MRSLSGKQRAQAWKEKLKLAGQAYGNGCNCSQAVFCAFAGDMGLDETTAYKLMEGFGGGFGAMQEVCGAFCVAAVVISYYTSVEPLPYI